MAPCLEVAIVCRAAGAAAYLAKPFGAGELRDVVARILSGPPAREGFSGPAASADLRESR
jgi:DNA-binding response OmpR family regulator